MNDRFHELTVFVRAADSGSFSAAARMLGISQPSVSRIVGELEARLGTRLLLRSTRRIVMTEAGTAYLQKAREILTMLEKADDSAREIDSVRGSLRVAAPSVLCLKILIPAMPAFLAEHPFLKIAFLTSDHMQDLISDNVDIAIRFGPMHDSAYGVRKLASLERVLLGAPAYLLERGVPITPADLARHDTLLGAVGAVDPHWRFERGGVEESIKLAPRVSFNSTEAAIASASAGLGIARAAAALWRLEMASGHLVRVLADYRLDPIDVHAVYPAGRVPSDKVRLFTAFVEQSLQQSCSEIID